jgi:hypothetical protein
MLTKMQDIKQKLDHKDRYSKFEPEGDEIFVSALVALKCSELYTSRWLENSAIFVCLVAAGDILKLESRMSSDQLSVIAYTCCARIISQLVYRET